MNRNYTVKWLWSVLCGHEHPDTAIRRDTEDRYAMQADADNRKLELAAATKAIAIRATRDLHPHTAANIKQDTRTFLKSILIYTVCHRAPKPKLVRSVFAIP